METFWDRIVKAEEAREAGRKMREGKPSTFQVHRPWPNPAPAHNRETPPVPAPGGES